MLLILRCSTSVMFYDDILGRGRSSKNTSSMLPVAITIGRAICLWFTKKMTFPYTNYLMPLEASMYFWGIPTELRRQVMLFAHNMDPRFLTNTEMKEASETFRDEEKYTILKIQFSLDIKKLIEGCYFPDANDPDLLLIAWSLKRLTGLKLSLIYSRYNMKNFSMCFELGYSTIELIRYLVNLVDSYGFPLQSFQIVGYTLT